VVPSQIREWVAVGPLALFVSDAAFRTKL
jgi:hypothetical protein